MQTCFPLRGVVHPSPQPASDCLPCPQVFDVITTTISIMIIITTITIIMLCRYMKRPVMSCPGLYDPTNIMDANTLSRLITLCEDW